MRLRTKLVLAQAPLALALGLVGVLASAVTAQLGEQSSQILADNYRSVLAAQRMKESLERLDKDALLVLAGQAVDAQGHRPATGPTSRASWPSRRATSPSRARGRRPSACGPAGAATGRCWSGSRRRTRRSNAGRSTWRAWHRPSRP